MSAAQRARGLYSVFFAANVFALFLLRGGTLILWDLASAHPQNGRTPN
jgi:hypothetical protein